MFYNQLIKLCNERNLKPSPVVRSLGISATNLKKWQEGATVNSSILQKLAEYFDVPIDYFFQEDDIVTEEKSDDNPNAKGKIYNAIMSHPDRIASLRNGLANKVCIAQVAEYLKCSAAFLTDDPDYKGSPNEKKIKNVKDHILILMDKVPADEKFKVIQVKISYLVINNLEKAGIYKQHLIDIKLSKQKVEALYNREVAPKNKRGFNLSDIGRISEELDISIDFLFTGDE